MAKFDLIFKPFGEKALLIEWPLRIEQAILEDIINYQNNLEKELSNLIEECIPTFQSLTIIFNPEKVNYAELLQKVQGLNNSNNTFDKSERRRWFIPVCYDPEFGPDQATIAETAGISIAEVIKLHSSTTYTVYFIGFLPGFLYLGGLPPQLHTDRKATPDMIIPKGAVAIGGSQTGIYPIESPGGWQIVGRTPISLFDAVQTPPCFALPGDLVQFISVEKQEFLKLEAQVNEGAYKVKMDLPDL